MFSFCSVFFKNIFRRSFSSEAGPSMFCQFEDNENFEEFYNLVTCQFLFQYFHENVNTISKYYLGERPIPTWKPCSSCWRGDFDWEEIGKKNLFVNVVIDVYLHVVFDVDIDVIIDVDLDVVVDVDLGVNIVADLDTFFCLRRHWLKKNPDTKKIVNLKHLNIWTFWQALSELSSCSGASCHGHTRDVTKKNN